MLGDRRSTWLSPCRATASRRRSRSVRAGNGVVMPILSDWPFRASPARPPTSGRGLRLVDQARRSIVRLAGHGMFVRAWAGGRAVGALGRKQSRRVGLTRFQSSGCEAGLRRYGRGRSGPVPSGGKSCGPAVPRAAPHARQRRLQHQRPRGSVLGVLANGLPDPSEAAQRDIAAWTEDEAKRSRDPRSRFAVRSPRARWIVAATASRRVPRPAGGVRRTSALASTAGPSTAALATAAAASSSSAHVVLLLLPWSITGGRRSGVPGAGSMFGRCG